MLIFSQFAKSLWDLIWNQTWESFFWLWNSFKKNIFSLSLV
jgi:hypothetical protein